MYCSQKLGEDLRAGLVGGLEKIQIYDDVI